MWEVLYLLIIIDLCINLGLRRSQINFQLFLKLSNTVLGLTIKTLFLNTNLFWYFPLTPILFRPKFRFSMKYLIFHTKYFIVYLVFCSSLMYIYRLHILTLLIYFLWLFFSYRLIKIRSLVNMDCLIHIIHYYLLIHKFSLTKSWYRFQLHSHRQCTNILLVWTGMYYVNYNLWFKQYPSLPVILFLFTSLV